MALTRIAPAGIGTTPEGSGFNIGSSNLHGLGLDATNAKFTGIVTSQNIRVLGDLQVDGTTTTLDTVVTSVDKLEVEANNTTVAVAITQSGSGDGMIVLGGNLGVGTASPSQPLHVEGNARITGILSVGQGTITLDSSQNMIKLGALTMHRDGSSGDAILMNTGGTYNPFRASKFLIDAVEVIDNSKVGKNFSKIGIGTDNPTRNLVVNNSAQSDILIKSGNGNYAQLIFGDTDADFRGSISYKHNDDTMQLYTAGSEKLRISSAGNVGIGTVNPNYTLVVAKQDNAVMIREGAGTLAGMTPNTSQKLWFQGGNAEIGLFRDSGGAYEYIIGTWQSSTHIPLVFRTGNRAERMRIQFDGKIGIGTATPNWLTTIQGGTGGAQTTLLNLHVHETSAGTGSILRFSNSTAVTSTYGTAEIRAIRTAYNTGYTDLIFTTSDGDAVTEKVRIKGGTGNIGIGTDTFTATSSGRKIVEIDGASGALINLAVGGARKAYHYTDGTDVYSYNTANGNYIIGTNNTEKLRITSAGDVGIGENSPADRLVVQKANASADVGIRIKNDTTTDGNASNPTTASLYLNTSTSDFNTFYIQARRNDNYTHFGYADPRASGHVPYMVLTNDRKTLIGGATAPYSDYNGTNGGWNGGHYINVGGSTQWGTLHIADWDDHTTKDSYGGTNIFISRCKSETIGDHSGGALAANNPIARLLFNGSDGAHFRNAAWIECKVDGTPGSNNMPGLLSFATSAGSGAAPVERMRIESSGQTTIGGAIFNYQGTSKPYNNNAGTLWGTANVVLSGQWSSINWPSDSSDPEPNQPWYMMGRAHGATDRWTLSIRPGNSNNLYPIIDCYNNANGTIENLIFSTNAGNEKMRITSAGYVGIGEDTPIYALHLNRNLTGTSDYKNGTMIRLNGSNGANILNGLGFGYSTTGSPTNIHPSAFIGTKVSSWTSYVKHHIVFATRDVDTNTNPTERVRITDNGAFLVGTTSTGAGRYAFYNPGSSGGDSTNDKTMGMYVRNDAGPTHVNLSAVDNFTLRLHNGAYAGSGIADPQGSITKILFHGVSHNGWNNYAAICMDVQGTSNGRGELVFLTGGDSSSMKERVRITRGGATKFVANTNVDVIYSSAVASGTSAVVFRGSHSATANVPGSGTDSVYIYANGNIQNTNNSYGQISDIKLKENIVDAGSQWDDFKAVRFRKYNFKAETGHETHTQLGVIAQELELTSPGLVYEVAEKDEDGNPTGESTKAVMSSVLTNKALVALQEAMARIETLEAKVAALEGS